MTDNVTIQKLDLRGEVSLSYTGRVLAQTEDEMVVEAIFGRKTRVLSYVTFKTGDRFVEYFYARRWYNVFVVYDADDGALKGWYCNITRPAEFVSDGAGGLVVRAVDLALDYFRKPTGQELVLDEDEFEALNLPLHEQQAARAALDELRRLAAEGAGPFAHR